MGAVGVLNVEDVFHDALSLTDVHRFKFDMMGLRKLPKAWVAVRTERVASGSIRFPRTPSICLREMRPRPATPRINSPSRSQPTITGTYSSLIPARAAFPPRFLGRLRFETLLSPFSE